MYIIKRITDKNGIDKTDAASIKRLGRRGTFLFPLSEGLSACLAYEPRKGEDYNGILRTSTVEAIYGRDNSTEREVHTRNSVYYFEEEERELQ